MRSENAGGGWLLYRSKPDYRLIWIKLVGYFFPNAKLVRNRLRKTANQ